MVRVVSRSTSNRSFSLFSSLSWFSVIVFIGNILLTGYSLVAFYSVNVSPARHWIAGFFTLSIPVVLAGHLLFILYWLFVAPWRSLLSGLVLIMAFPLLQRTLTFNSPPDPPENSFKVLSFNTQLFNANEYFHTGSKEGPKQAIGWVKENGADILCLQEFYNEDKITAFNSISQLAAKGYNSYMTPLFRLNKHFQGFFGVAIFTKFPIVGSGDLIFNRNTLNKGVYADVLIGSDTVRIINIHLHSMSLKTEKLGMKKDLDAIKDDSKNTFWKLRKGFVTRARQIGLVEELVQKSPYPVILCGDFNEIPYSYVYQRIRRQLRNAFEDAGNGFGFTLNKQKLFFIRIDNQFYDSSLKAHSFTTHREVTYSDHFPISAVYSIPKEK
jgi:endonuclease/exonuclease/phosphatase family metal-dependent hydrolase